MALLARCRAGYCRAGYCRAGAGLAELCTGFIYHATLVRSPLGKSVLNWSGDVDLSDMAYECEGS